MKFEKPPLTLKAQVDLLRSRGLIIEDSAKAEHYLQHINYYRLRSYLIPFEANSTTHTVRPETSFDSVLELYVFDRELRLLLLDAIERFEVALRTRWALIFPSIRRHPDKRVGMARSEVSDGAKEV